MCYLRGSIGFAEAHHFGFRQAQSTTVPQLLWQLSHPSDCVANDSKLLSPLLSHLGMP